VKLLSVPLARTLWTFDINEANPRGKNIFADLVPALVETFEFKKYPQLGDDFSKGMVLELGNFTTAKGDDIQIKLTIWSDGAAADSLSNTSDTDEFLAVVAELLPQYEYAFDPEMIRRKSHRSQVFVKCDKPIHLLNPRLDQFCAKLSEESFGNPVFRLGSIEFWPDQTGLHERVARFSFERKVGVPFAENRYFSEAGLSTDKHLELLNELEMIF